MDVLAKYNATPDTEARFLPPPSRDFTRVCSFCAREGVRLVIGPCVSICDECAGLAVARPRGG